MALQEVRSVTSTSYNRKYDVTYVYQVTTYLDTDTGKQVKKRHVCGKLDENGTIVPTGKPGRPRIHPVKPKPKSANTDSVDYKSLYSQLQKQRDYEQASATDTRDLMLSLKKDLQTMSASLGNLNDAIDSFMARWRQLE